MCPILHGVAHWLGEHADKNNDGVIDMADTEEMGPKEKEMVEEGIKMCDENGDGKIEECELMKCLEACYAEHTESCEHLNCTEEDDCTGEFLL